MRRGARLRAVKRVAQTVGAVASAVAAIVALSPFVRKAWAAVTSALTPYLDMLRPYALWAGFVSLALFVYLAVTLYNSWRHRSALMTTLVNRLALDLQNDSGTKANFTQSIHVRADVDDVEVYRHRLWGNGTYSEPAIRAEGYNYSVEPPIEEHGLRCYDLRFIPPLARGRQVWHSFQCVFENAFTSNQEHLNHPVDYRERHLAMEIIFPKNRPPKKASAHLMQGLVKTKITDIEPDETQDGRKRIRWQLKRPELGRSYRVEWEW